MKREITYFKDNHAWCIAVYTIDVFEKKQVKRYDEKKPPLNCLRALFVSLCLLSQFLHISQTHRLTLREPRPSRKLKSAK